jgi:hypothetical protein
LADAAECSAQRAMFATPDDDKIRGRTPRRFQKYLCGTTFVTRTSNDAPTSTSG